MSDVKPAATKKLPVGARRVLPAQAASAEPGPPPRRPLPRLGTELLEERKELRNRNSLPTFYAALGATHVPATPPPQRPPPLPPQQRQERAGKIEEEKLLVLLREEAVANEERLMGLREQLRTLEYARDDMRQQMANMEQMLVLRLDRAKEDPLVLRIQQQMKDWQQKFRDGEMDVEQWALQYVPSEYCAQMLYPEDRPDGGLKSVWLQPKTVREFALLVTEPDGGDFEFSDLPLQDANRLVNLARLTTGKAVRMQIMRNLRKWTSPEFMTGSFVFEEADEMFESYDADGNGKLELSELEVLFHYGLNQNASLAEKAMDCMNVANGECMTREQFRNFMTRVKQFGMQQVLGGDIDLEVSSKWEDGVKELIHSCGNESVCVFERENFEVLKVRGQIREKAVEKLFGFLSLQQNQDGQMVTLRPSMFLRETRDAKFNPLDLLDGGVLEVHLEQGRLWLLAKRKDGSILAHESVVKVSELAWPKISFTLTSGKKLFVLKDQQGNTWEKMLQLISFSQVPLDGVHLLKAKCQFCSLEMDGVPFQFQYLPSPSNSVLALSLVSNEAIFLTFGTALGFACMFQTSLEDESFYAHLKEIALYCF